MTVAVIANVHHRRFFLIHSAMQSILLIVLRIQYIDMVAAQIKRSAPAKFARLLRCALAHLLAILLRSFLTAVVVLMPGQPR